MVPGMGGRSRGGSPWKAAIMQSFISYLVVMAALVAGSAGAFAQDYTPRLELGIGYSYSSMHVPNSGQRANMHGLLIDSTANLNRWLGLSAELGTHYHCISGCWDPWGGRTDPDERNDSLSFMAGPRVVLRRGTAMSPWLHALAGISRVSYSSIYGAHTSVSGLGLVGGGGLDVPLHSFTLRVIQLDYLRMPMPGGSSDNVRVGAGVLLRLGRKQGGRK